MGAKRAHESVSVQVPCLQASAVRVDLCFGFVSVVERVESGVALPGRFLRGAAPHLRIFGCLGVGFECEESVRIIEAAASLSCCDGSRGGVSTVGWPGTRFPTSGGTLIVAGGVYICSESLRIRVMPTTISGLPHMRMSSAT